MFRPEVDTTYALGCGQTTGSRATLFGGRAVVERRGEAARRPRRRPDARRARRPRVCGRRGRRRHDGAGRAGGATIKTHTAFGYATQVCILDEQRPRGTVRRRARRRARGEPGALRGADRGVDPHGPRLRAHRGAAAASDGMPVTFKLRDIGVLRARDMPEVEVILVEEPEPEGPFGAKGVGEIGLVPTAAAVAGALEAFDGIRRCTLPMKDSPAARAMSVGRDAGGAVAVAAGLDRHVPRPLRRDGVILCHCCCDRHCAACMFVNAHTHLYSGLAPLGMPAPSPRPATFLEILERVWWRLDRALDEASLRAAARYYVAAALPGGHRGPHRSPRVAEPHRGLARRARRRLRGARDGGRALLRRDRAQRRARRGAARPRRVPPVHPCQPASRRSPAWSACTRRSPCRTRRSARPATCAASSARSCTSTWPRTRPTSRTRGAGVTRARSSGWPPWVPCRRLDPGARRPPDAGAGREGRDAGCWLVQNPRSNRNNRVGYLRGLRATSRVALGTDGFASDMPEEARALTAHCRGGRRLARPLGRTPGRRLGRSPASVLGYRRPSKPRRRRCRRSTSRRSRRRHDAKR